MEPIDSSKKPKNLEGLLNTKRLMRTAFISLAVGSATVVGCLYLSHNISEKEIINKAGEVTHQYYSTYYNSVKPLAFGDISDSIKIETYKSNVDKYINSIDSLNKEYLAIVSSDKYLEGKSKQNNYLLIGMSAFLLGASLMMASILKYTYIRQKEDDLELKQLEEK